MTTKLTAVYEHGAFRPEVPFELPEGSRVVLDVTVPRDPVGPDLVSRDDKKRLLHEVVERMMKNPLPPDAPHFSRDDMYDRG